MLPFVLSILRFMHARSSEPFATVLCQMEPASSEDDRTAVAAAKASERKRLKHREYVKKSYKKKLVRRAGSFRLSSPSF